MLSNSGPVGKLYMSIIEDVIENVRDIILEEGLEDEVLDDLKRIWASKVLQSKALEDLWNNNITHSKFVLKLPANYNASDQDRRPRVSVGIPSSQNVHHFPFKKVSDALATFSLPPGLSYPVQIPAGVTLQTASGHLYKVNIPVVVTQGPGGRPTFPQTAQKTIGCRGTSVPQPAAAARPVNTLPPPEAPPPLPPALDSSKTLPRGPNQDDVASQHTQVPPAEDRPAPPEVSVAGGNQPVQEPPFMEFLDLRMETLETLAQAPAGSMSKDIDDILKEVIENELNKAVDKSGFDNFPELSDIVQLDGPFDNSDTEAEDDVALEDNDFLGIISAQAMQGADGSSPSSSSGSDEPVEEVELDPLDSGDDVTEQYVPDPFDTDNVIVCQFDKIHRSKNRWKFHLKDGVMCYGGRDYVFSKAVGEAEW